MVKGPRVRLVHKVPKVLRVELARKGPQVRLGLKGLKAQQVVQERLDQQELKVLRELKVGRGLEDKEVIPVLKDHKVPKEQLVRKEV